MIEYIYFVKCPNCEDESFSFFNEAKEFALNCLSQKPIITQIEVDRNDFGECIDSCDLGTVWSWEDIMQETDAEPTISVFTRDDLKCTNSSCDPEFDNLDNSIDFELDDVPDNFKKHITESYATKEFEIPNFDAEIIDEFEDEGIKGYNIVYSKNGTAIVEVEVWETDSPVAVNRNLHTPNLMQGYYSSFDAFASDLEYKTSKYVRVRESAERKPIPEGMTIEQLVEEMEENEDTVECVLCQDLFDKSTCRKELNLGWLCHRCADDLTARGEGPVFKEDNYWDFLDEDTEKPIDEDLDWHTYKITFSTKANPDKEQTTTFKTWQSDVEYAWRKSNANIPHTTIKNIELVEDLNQETKTWTCVFDGHEIGTVEAATEEEAYFEMERKYPEYNYGLYDGVAVVYPANNNLETLEEPDTYSKHLADCPECGATKSFDHETGICIECGFSV